MSNVDSPFGFQVVDNVNAGGIENLQQFEIDASHSTVIGLNDPIAYDPSTNNWDAATVLTLKRNTAVVSSILNSEGVRVKTLPALEAGTVEAIPVFGRAFKVQTDSGTDFLISNIGQGADIVVGVPDPITGISTFELDTNTLGTGTAVRALYLFREEDNDFGEHAVVVVSFMENFYTTFDPFA